MLPDYWAAYGGEFQSSDRRRQIIAWRPFDLPRTNGLYQAVAQDLPASLRDSGVPFAPPPGDSKSMLVKQMIWKLTAAGIVALSSLSAFAAERSAQTATKPVASISPSTSAAKSGNSTAITAKGASGKATDADDDDDDPPKPPLDEGIIHGEKPLNPRVLFITAKNDPKSDAALANLSKAGGDFETLRSAGWTIGETADKNIQIVDRDRIPQLAKQLYIPEYPAVACVDNGKVVRSFKSGCTTPLDMWTLSWLAKGVNERPTAPVLEAALVATTGHWPLRGNHWSVSGDWNPSREEVIAHLRGANHASELQADWKIEDWSYEELRSLHDDLHERYPSDNPVSSGPEPGVYHSKGDVR